MAPYFIFLFVVLSFLFLRERTKSDKRIYNFYSRIIFLLLVLFAGLRDLRVGSDTSGYAHRFEDKKMGLEEFLLSSSRDEWGYHFLEFIASLFSNEYVVILLTIAFVTVFFQLKTIFKLSNQPLISVFILITFGIYTYVFNGARQALAGSIYMYAIVFLIRKDFRKYVFWVIIAFLFHKSVILGIPLYFLFRKKFTKKLFILLVLGALIVGSFFTTFISYAGVFNARYAVYQKMDVQGGAYLTLAYVLLAMFFILIRSRIRKEYLINYDIYLNMFLFGTVIFLVVFFTGAYVEITRLAFYYLLSTVFIWPIILKSLQGKSTLLLYLSFILAHFIFYYIFIGKMAGLTPYLLNRSIF